MGLEDDEGLEQLMCIQNEHSTHEGPVPESRVDLHWCTQGCDSAAEALLCDGHKGCQCALVGRGTAGAIAREVLVQFAPSTNGLGIHGLVPSVDGKSLSKRS